MDGVLVLVLVLVWLLLALPVAIVICLVIRRADDRRPATRVIDVDSVPNHLEAAYRPLGSRDTAPAPGTAAHHTSPDQDVRDAPPDQTTRRPSAR